MWSPRVNLGILPELETNMSNHEGEIILTTYACITLDLLPKALGMIADKEVRIHHLHLNKGLRSGRGAYRVVKGSEVIPFKFRYVDIDEPLTMELVVLDDTYKAQFDYPGPWEITVTKMHTVTMMVPGESQVQKR